MLVVLWIFPFLLLLLLKNPWPILDSFQDIMLLLLRLVLFNCEIMSLCFISFSVFFRLFLEVSLFLYWHFLPQDTYSFHYLLRTPVWIFFLELLTLLITEENIGGERSSRALINYINLAWVEPVSACSEMIFVLLFRGLLVSVNGLALFLINLSAANFFLLASLFHTRFW